MQPGASCSYKQKLRYRSGYMHYIVDRKVAGSVLQQRIGLAWIKNMHVQMLAYGCERILIS